MVTANSEDGSSPRRFQTVIICETCNLNLCQHDPIVIIFHWLADHKLQEVDLDALSSLSLNGKLG